MRKYGALCVALAMVAMFAACSSPEPAPKPDTAPGTELPKPAPEAAPAPVPAPAPVAPAPVPAPAPEAAPAPAPAAPAAAAPAVAGTLVGSTWKLGEFTANFKDDTTVSLKGGQLAAIAPDGLDAKYTLKDGKVELNAMGMTKNGTFDGTNLVIDGTTAVRQQ